MNPRDDGCQTGTSQGEDDQDEAGRRHDLGEEGAAGQELLGAPRDGGGAEHEVGEHRPRNAADDLRRDVNGGVAPRARADRRVDRDTTGLK